MSNDRSLRRSAWARSLMPLIGILFASWASFAESPLLGDVVWFSDGRRAFGEIVGETENSLTWRPADRDQPVREIPKSEIATLVRTIDRARLEALTPAQLDPYLEYAEELASQKVDPLARELALRLYLIVADHDRSPGRTRCRSALRALPELARSADERKKFVALQQFYFPSDLPAAQVPPEAGADRPETRLALVSIIRNLRQEQMALARETLALPEIQGSVTWIEQWIDWKELERLLNQPDLNARAVRQLVEWELLLQIPGRVRTRELTHGATQAGQAAGPRLVVPQFGNVTKFDPQRCLYREGKWIHSPSHPHRKPGRSEGRGLNQKKTGGEASRFRP